jgi:hypothetical protein
MARQVPLTKEDRKNLPAIGSQEEVLDPIVHVKFFNPMGAQTWYVLEFDGEDILFTYVTGTGYDELGYSSLSEMMAVKLPFGLYIERDIHWTPTPLSKVKAGEAR